MRPAAFLGPQPAFLRPATLFPRRRPRATHKFVMALPTGPHQVGILDCRLPDSYPPSIRVRIFYPTPAAPTPTTPAPWLPSHPTRSDQSTHILSFLPLPTPLHPLLRPLLTDLSQQPLPALHAPPIADGVFPLVVFSHGLGGSLGGYSHACLELASHGRVVLAPEHSDGSAFVAYVGQERAKVPYIWYNPALHGVDRVFRGRQLEKRLADLRRVLSCVERGDRFVPLDGGSVPELKVDTDKLVVAGHSFGGCTALLFGAEVKAAKIVCLDAWLYPVEDLTDLELGESDCLFVDMGGGMKQSVTRREELPRPREGGLVDAVCIQGGLHNNSSDFPMRLPRLVAVAAGMTGRGSDPIRILEVQSEVVERFVEGGSEWLRFREGLVGGDGEVGEAEADGGVKVVVAPVGRARSAAAVRR